MDRGARTVKKAWEIKLQSLKKIGEEIERRRIDKINRQNNIGSNDSYHLSSESEDSCKGENYLHINPDNNDTEMKENI